MAKFIFRLENFLKVKDKLEEKAKTEYGDAISKLEEEKMILENLKNQKVCTITEIKQSITTNINTFDIKIKNDFINLLDKKIESQLQNIKLATDFVEEKRQNLIIAMKDKKMFEILKENEKETYIKELLQKEQKMVDELVSYKYNNG